MQRVAEAAVTVGGREVGRIGPGLAVLLAVTDQDGDAEADYVARKVAGLRVFQDEEGRMNRSAVECGGEALLISQFTLYGDCRKGRRPSFTRAAGPEHAEQLYELVAQKLREHGLRVATGSFGARMQVSLVNDGPVTLLLDSERAF